MIEIIFNSGTSEEVVIPSSAIERFEIFNSDNAYYQSAYLILHGIDFVPEINDTCQIYVNNSLEFNGYVSRINKDLAGTKVYKIQAIGKTYDLKRYYISEASFENATTGYIASSLVANFTSLSPAGINPTGGILVDNITFQHKTVFDCLAQLSKIDGYKFFVDNNDNVHYYKVIPSSIGTFTDDDILRIIELETSDDKLYNEVHLTGGEWYSKVQDYSATSTDKVYISGTNEYVAVRIDRPGSATYLKGLNFYLSKSTTDPQQLQVRNLDDSFNLLEKSQTMYIDSSSLPSTTGWTNWQDYVGSGVEVPTVSLLEFSCPNLISGAWWAFECRPIPSSSTFNISPSGYADIRSKTHHYNMGYISGDTVEIDFEGKCVADYVGGCPGNNRFGYGTLSCSGLVADKPKLYISGSVNGQVLNPDKEDKVGAQVNYMYDRHTFPRCEIGYFDSSRNFGFGLSYNLVRWHEPKYFIATGWQKRAYYQSGTTIKAYFRKVNSSGDLIINKTQTLTQYGASGVVGWEYGDYYEPGQGAVIPVSWYSSSTYKLQFVYFHDTASSSNDKIKTRYSGGEVHLHAAACCSKINGVNRWYIFWIKGTTVYLDKWDSDLTTRIWTKTLSLTGPEGYVPYAIYFAYPIDPNLDEVVILVQWKKGSSIKCRLHFIDVEDANEFYYLLLGQKHYAYSRYALKRFKRPVLVFAWWGRISAIGISTGEPHPILFTIDECYNTDIDAEGIAAINPATADICYIDRYGLANLLPGFRYKDTVASFDIGVTLHNTPARNGYILGDYIYFVDTNGKLQKYSISNDTLTEFCDLSIDCTDWYSRGHLYLVDDVDWSDDVLVAPVIFQEQGTSTYYENEAYIGFHVIAPTSLQLYVNNDYQLVFDTSDNRTQTLHPSEPLDNGVMWGDYIFEFDTVYTAVVGTGVESSDDLGTSFFKITGNLKIFADTPTAGIIYKSVDSGNTWENTNKVAIFKAGWDKGIIEAHASSQTSIDLYGRHPLIKSFPDIRSVNALQSIANSLINEFSEPQPYGAILVSGNTNVDVGKTLSIQSERLGNYDDLIIKSHRHKFDKKLGFVTEIRFGQEEFNIAAEVAKLKESVFGGNIV